MTASVLLEGVLKDGEVDNFTEIAREAFKINLTLNVENRNNFVLTEKWESKEHYEKYLAFRTEDGTVELIGSLCDEGPTIRIFDISDA